jgi:hypothetical protein
VQERLLMLVLGVGRAPTPLTQTLGRHSRMKVTRTRRLGMAGGQQDALC